MFTLQLHLPHTWYVAGNFMPVYVARQLNESVPFHPPLPTMGPDDVFLMSAPKAGPSMNWAQQFVTYATGGTSRIEYGE